MRRVIISAALSLSTLALGQTTTAARKILETPLHFEENTGQFGAPVRFAARGAGYRMYFTDSEVAIALKVSADTRLLRMRIAGASPRRPSGLQELPGRSNYFIGADPARWRRDIRTFAKVEYAGVVPGVDVVYYGNGRQLEYDLVVAPGTDPEAIRVTFEGAQRLRISGDGDVALDVAGHELLQRKPVIYQEVDGVRHAVEGRYAREGQRSVGFEIGDYDRSRPLIIDPVLVYSSYLGGSGTDDARGVALDSAGNIYVTGNTTSSNFPLLNPYDSSYTYNDVFVTKLNAAGSALVYSTYLGGSSPDTAYGIAVDPSGSAWVVGVTNSSDFPKVNAHRATLGAYADGFVVRLAPSGSSLTFSTYVGGDGEDTVASIALDGAGNGLIAGQTASSDFSSPGVLQTVRKGYRDAFVAKFSPAGSRLFATYLGGSSDDRATSIATDSSGNAYVVGATTSTDFPTVNPLPAVPTSSGGFVTKMNASGTALVYSTYFGSTSSSYYYYYDPIAVDAAGNAYVAGPGVPLAVPAVQLFGATTGIYVAKLTPSGQFSHWTGIGQTSGYGSPDVRAIAVDAAGHVYIAGAAPDNFFTTSPFQAANGGNTDAFVAKLNLSGEWLVYSSFLGGSNTDAANAIALDAAGNVVVVGYTTPSYSTTPPPLFPLVAPLQPSPGGGTDAFVARITDSSMWIDTLTPRSAPEGGPAFTLTVDGSGFTPSTVIRWNGEDRPTSYVNANRVTVAIPASDLATEETVPITIAGVTGSPGPTPFIPFRITPPENPVPAVSSLSPNNAVLGSAPFTIAVYGGGFVPGSVVRWNGADRATTYYTSGYLTAALLAADLTTQTGPIPVTVFNPAPGGGVSREVNFTVNISHSITSLSPSSAIAGGPAFSLTVNGVNFVTGSVVRWQGSDRPTTFVSANQLIASITSDDIYIPGTAEVKVFIPGPAGGLSAGKNFTVGGHYPVPVITSISPLTATRCSSVNVTIQGTGFTGSTSIQVNGVSVYSPYSSGLIRHTELSFTYTPTTSGPNYLTVTNPTPGGGLSNAMVLDVATAPPVISSLSRTSAVEGSPGFTLSVNTVGCSFPADAVVRWNGSNRTTTNYYAFTLHATIPASDLATPGSAQITVYSPTAGESAPVSFAINPLTSPAPGISSLLPSMAMAGGISFSMTVHGSGFVSSSVVRWNGNARTTTFVSTTQLRAAITAADIAAPGTALVTVFNPAPGGGTSSQLTFTITPLIAPGGAVTAGFVGGMPGAAARIPITLNLNPGVTIDHLSFGVAVTPAATAVPLTGTLAFEKDPALPDPTTVDTGGGPNAIAVFWSSLTTPLSGSVTVGSVVVNVPALGAAGQSYTVQVTAADSSSGLTPIPLTVGSGLLTVAADYLVADVFPATSSAAGTFGDNTLAISDLIHTLRAVTSLPGARPPSCSDRFDAMDSYPADTSTARGGDGSLTILDLIVALRRVVGVDLARPRRVSRALACTTAAEPDMAEPSSPEASLRIALGPQEDSRIPVYLVAREAVELAGLSLALGADESVVRFEPAGEVRPSLSDDGLPGKAVVAWLAPLAVPQGRFLLGYLETTANPERVVVYGISAAGPDGSRIQVGRALAVQ
jgi:hypothetical protein